MNKKKDNNNILITIVIILLVIIAILGFFLGKNYNGATNGTNIVKNIKIKVIEDKRCSECKTDEIVSQLKLIPALSNIEVETKDFSDKGIEKYLKENNINALPAIIFNGNQIDSNINSYLTQLPSEEYSLQIGASFNPFLERSERGFTILDKEQLKEIKENSFIKGNEAAEVTWLEYSDLECPYCAKLHNAGTPEDLAEKYGNKLNQVFNHFPLQFHNNALPGAQIAECLGEQKGSEAFYKLIETSFAEEDSNKKFLIAEAVKLGADEDSLKECLNSDKYEEKVTKQMETGAKLFGITGTPGNILINNTTGEYEIISGAYPTSAFETIIDKLLEK